jgi:hypothetical protein
MRWFRRRREVPDEVEVMAIEGVEPRFPTTVEEFNRFCQALAFLATPSAASQRLNESAAMLREQLAQQYREKEMAFAAREAALHERETALNSWEQELKATAHLGEAPKRPR